jgi:hypothetical protein
VADHNLDDYLKMLGGKHKEAGLKQSHMETGREAFVECISVGGANLTLDQKSEMLDAYNMIQAAMGYPLRLDEEVSG